MQIRIDGADHEVLAWRYEGTDPKTAVMVLADKTVIVTPSYSLRRYIHHRLYPLPEITIHPWPDDRPNNLVPVELNSCGGIDDSWNYFVRYDDGRIHPAIVEDRPHPSDESAEIGAEAAQENYLTVKDAAVYCGRTERTIRNWIKQMDGDEPMLPGIKKNGREYRIPKSSLQPWRNPSSEV